VVTATTRTPSARAQAMSRGVSPTTTVRSRGPGRSGSARPRPGHPGQLVAGLGVRAEAALPLGEVPRQPRGGELATGDLLVVARHQRRPERLRPRGQGLEHPGDPPASPWRPGRAARTPRRCARAPPAHRRRSRTPPAPQPSAATARWPGPSAPRRPPRKPRTSTPWYVGDVRRAAPRRARARRAGAASRRCPRGRGGAPAAWELSARASGRRRRAARTAAISRAHASTSSSWTISTGECI
jgi:hypothetical protein